MYAVGLPSIIFLSLFIKYSLLALIMSIVILFSASSIQAISGVCESRVSVLLIGTKHTPAHH